MRGGQVQKGAVLAFTKSAGGKVLPAARRPPHRSLCCAKSSVGTSRPASSEALTCPLPVPRRQFSPCSRHRVQAASAPKRCFLKLGLGGGTLSVSCR